MAWLRNFLSFFSFRSLPSIFQGGRREIDPSAHTIKSHGASVAKNHMHDWLILLLLVGIEITLVSIHPFYRYVGKDMMTDLKYPLKDNTVPVWSVPMYAVLLPIFVFLIVYMRRRDVYDLHHAILGLLFSVLLTAVITDSIKNGVGRPRPDFFWRCFPNGTEAYDRSGNVICHGKESDIREGHKSFPSGHTSCKQMSTCFLSNTFCCVLSLKILKHVTDIVQEILAGSFAGLGFLAYYLSGKIQVFDSRGHVAKLCLVFLPLLCASLVGVSRVNDYWHHWQDVFAGAIIGLVVSAFCYLQFFPAPYNDNGWGPYAYFRAQEEFHARANTTQSPTAPDVHAADRQPRSNGDTYIVPSPMDRVPSHVYDEMELGGR